MVTDVTGARLLYTRNRLSTVPIVDLFAPFIKEAVNQDAVDLLRIYETAYPPDLALAMTDVPDLLDFHTRGGDITIVGFWYGAKLEHLLARAMQDFLLRIMMAKGSTRFASDMGNGPLTAVPAASMSAVIMMAVADSPFLDSIRQLTVESGAADAIDIQLELKTITGESLTFGLTTTTVL